MGCGYSSVPPVHPVPERKVMAVDVGGGKGLLAPLQRQQARVGRGCSSLATTAMVEFGDDLRLPPPPTVVLSGSRSFASPKRVACRHGCGLSVSLADAQRGRLSTHEGSCVHGAALRIVSCPICRIRGVSGAKHHVRRDVKKLSCGCGADEDPPETACELARVRGAARRYIAVQETRVECRQCGQRGIRDRVFHRHLANECPNRLTSCKLCGEGVLVRHASLHTVICPQRTVECVYACGEVLLARHRAIHETMLCPSRPVDCPLFCGAVVPRDAVREHAICLCPMRLSVWHTTDLIRAGREAATAAILHQRELELLKYPWKAVQQEFKAVEQQCLAAMVGLGYDPDFGYRRKVALHEVWRRFTQDHRCSHSNDDVSLSEHGMYQEPQMVHPRAPAHDESADDRDAEEDHLEEDPTVKTLDLGSTALCLGVPDFYLGQCSAAAALQASEFVQYVAAQCRSSSGGGAATVVARQPQQPPTGTVTLRRYLDHFSGMFGDEPAQAKDWLERMGWCGDFRTLSVPSKGFGAVAMAHLGRFLGSTAANETLTGLDLSKNDLCGFRRTLVSDDQKGGGSELLRWGVNVLVSGLSLNQSLCVLDLSGNALGWDGEERDECAVRPDGRKLARTGGAAWVAHGGGVKQPPRDGRYGTLGHLLGALECHPALTKLFLSRNGLGPAAARHINHLLVRCRRCGTVDRCKTTDHPGRCGRLRRLVLSCNPLGDAGVAALVRGLATPTRVHDPLAALRSLDLAACSVRRRGADVLARALQRSSCGLTTLDLSRNPLGWEGAQHLATALRRNKQLTSLRLRGASLGVKTDPCSAATSHDCSSTVALLGSLGYTGTLLALDLSDNDLDGTVAEALGHMFARTCGAKATLTALDVSDNSFRVNGLAKLLGSMANDSSSLCVLDVSRTAAAERSTQVSQLLGQVLRRNCSLTSLRASDVIADVDGATLARCLATSLREDSPNAGVLAKLDITGVLLDLTAVNVSPLAPEDGPPSRPTRFPDQADTIALATAAVAAAVQTLINGSALLSNVPTVAAEAVEAAEAAEAAGGGGGPTASSTTTSLHDAVPEKQEPLPLLVSSGLSGPPNNRASASSVTTLVLAGQCLLATDGVLLGNLLAAGYSPLKLLDVSRNHLGQSLDVALSSSGRGHATGATIRPSRSTPIGFVALARGIEASRCLTSVNLSHNYVAFNDELTSGRLDGGGECCDGMRVANALATALERTTSLEVLELENVVGLPMQTGKAFADALAVNKTLRTLNLAGNRLGLDPGAMASLEDDTTDVLLGGRNHGGVKQTGLVALAKAVAAHNSTLLQLDLRCNWLDDADVEAFRSTTYRGATATALIPPEMSTKLRLPLLVSWSRFFLMNKFQRERRHLMTADQEHGLLGRIFEYAGNPRSIRLTSQKEKRPINCSCGERCRVNPTSKVV